MRTNRLTDEGCLGKGVALLLESLAIDGDLCGKLIVVLVDDWRGAREARGNALDEGRQLRHNVDAVDAIRELSRYLDADRLGEVSGVGAGPF